MHEAEITLRLAFCLLSAGAFGALVKDIIFDGKLKMPSLLKGELILGSLGSMVIGAAAGYFVDHSTLTAFFAGFTGFAALEALMPRNPGEHAQKCEELNDENPTGPASHAFTIRKPFDDDFRLTQRFGENPQWYASLGYAGHFGLDWATPWGTAIKACDDGVVSRVGYTKGNGFFVELKHYWGYSLYLHFRSMPQILLGLMAKKGQTICYAGNTGDVRPKPTPEKPHAGTHLHFSIKVNGISNPKYRGFVDPTPFFA